MKNLSLSFLRRAAQVFVLISIAASFFYVVDAARHSNSIAHNSNANFLKLLFIIWVLLPLLSLLMANILSRAWSAITRKALYLSIMLVALASLISYSGLFLTAGMRQSTPFIIIPFLSWLFMAIVMPIATKVAEKTRY